ncbi:MAG: hypothetical protein L0215_07095 [Gemmataceae bacterium]|nr:hypothetical protein [Gemmataceae bacterium]
MKNALYGPPDMLRIPADGPIDFVGRLKDGTQYMTFVTGAVPDGYVFDRDQEWRKVKRWLAVLHEFDSEGNHLRSEVKLGGYDIEGKDNACEKADAAIHKMFDPLRKKGPKRCDIKVKPFSLIVDGITHGLIYETSQPEENGPVFEWVMLEPRDVMFHPPWNSGEWST